MFQYRTFVHDNDRYSRGEWSENGTNFFSTDNRMPSAKKAIYSWIISSPLAASFPALLGTTRRRRLWFGDELLGDAKASRSTLKGIKWNVSPECGMRFSECEQTRSIRPTIRSRREGIEICSRVADDDPPFPPVTRVARLVPIESGFRSSCLASKEYLYHIVKYQLTVLNCVVQCFLSI